MAKGYLSNRQKNLKVGIVSYTESNTVLEVTGKVGIGTTNATATLDVNGTLNVSGVSTFQDNVHLGDDDELIFGDGSDLKIYHNSSNNNSVIQETGSGNLNINADNLQIRDSAGNEIIAVFRPNDSVSLNYDNSKKFETIGTGATVTGDLYATTFYGDGTNLTLTDSVALGGDTTGDYVESITGTANEVEVTSGSGEGSTPQIGLPANVTISNDLIVSRDVQINRDLNVTGNITIGGTTATLFTETLTVSDAEIVLGFRTDAFDNDASNDTTANHGGIAVASTEGTPLVRLLAVGIETLPPTYKKILWFKEGTFSGLGTDAWLINYAVGIDRKSVV